MLSNKKKIRNSDDPQKQCLLEDKFNRETISSADVTMLLQETSSSSPISDDNEDDSWVISKSPMKWNQLVTPGCKSSTAVLKKNPRSCGALTVSPVKLKRKSELNKSKILSESPLSNGSPSKTNKNTLNEHKEVFTQIQNSSKLDRKNKLTDTDAEAKFKGLLELKLNSNNDKIMPNSSSVYPKENTKTVTTNSDLKSSISTLENVEPSTKSPRKSRQINKSTGCLKKAKVVIERLEIETIKKVSRKNQYSKSVNDDDNDLAVSLDLIVTNTQISNAKLNSNQVVGELRKCNKSIQSKKIPLCKSRIDKNMDIDESSSQASSLEESDENDFLPRRKSQRNIFKNEHFSPKEKNTICSVNVSHSSRPSCKSAPSAEKMSLKTRNEIKRPRHDDFELNESSHKSSLQSPKTPQKRNYKEEVDVVIKCGIDSSPSKRSPRSSSRIQQKDSAKKESAKKESANKKSTNHELENVLNHNNELPQTPRSSARLRNLSPLVDSVERISLRNRSDIKRPYNDEFEWSEKGRCLPAVNSPRTPSQSLRKQVLESSTTRSAKKKLIMDSESSDSDENYTPSRKTLRKLTSSITTPKKLDQRPSRSNKTPSKCTPEKSSISNFKTPVKTPSKKRGDPSTPCTPKTVRRVGQGFLTPVIEERSVQCDLTSSLQDVRLKLHVSSVPSTLPCRSNQFKNILSFISCKLNDKIGGCMYISGVPGTGKTATVHAVIKTLQQKAIDRKISPFDFVEVNGLRLTEARQAYVRIWQSLSGSKVSADQSLNNLEKKFSHKPSRPTVLLIDEMDYVCNRRQDVIYNVLDWSTKKHSRLVVLTIANTMDLPERTLKGRVTSRMGLTRLVFEPYTYQQLQEIVMNRIDGSSSFDSDAIQFVARKVAAVSGDARRALDICRRATELLDNAEKQVTLEHIDKTLSLIFLSRRVQAIKHCSYMAQLLLRSIRDETLRTGVEETNLKDVFSHLCSLCNLEGSWQPTLGQALSLCHSLTSTGLLSMEKGRRDILTKLTLNVSSDDVHYALSC